MANRYLLGFDVGSSSVKASLVNADNGKCVATAFYPEKEAPITAVKAGWAEQDPQMWWDNAKLSLQQIMKEAGAKTIRACASHCVMSGPASERVQNSALEEIVFTDSIPYSQRCAKVKQLSVADMFAETIRRVINNESISDQYIV